MDQLKQVGHSSILGNIRLDHLSQVRSVSSGARNLPHQTEQCELAAVECLERVELARIAHDHVRRVRYMALAWELAKYASEIKK